MKKITDLAAGDWVLLKSIMQDEYINQPRLVKSVGAKRVCVYMGFEPGDTKQKAIDNVAYAFATEAEANSFWRSYRAIQNTLSAELREAKHKFRDSLTILIAMSSTPEKFAQKS